MSNLLSNEQTCLERSTNQNAVAGFECIESPLLRVDLVSVQHTGTIEEDGDITGTRLTAIPATTSSKLWSPSGETCVIAEEDLLLTC